jgi:phosphate transport system ATP-binding protein
MEEALTEVGLWREVRDRLGEPALSLSGGQQQRLCIARALALQPEVVLMDEPCSALDPMSSAVIEDLIVKMKQRYTIAIVTHNLAQARRIADDVAIFWTVDGVGRVIEQGPAELVFAAPADPISASYLSGARG